MKIQKPKQNVYEDILRMINRYKEHTDALVFVLDSFIRLEKKRNAK